MRSRTSMRHEEFARQYILTDNASEAYRRAWAKFPGKRMDNPKTSQVLGCRLLKRPEIIATIEKRQQAMAKRADITEDKILSDYQWSIDAGKLQGKPDSVTNAATAQAKLVGLLRERQEIGAPGDFDNNTPAEQILAQVAAEKGPEKAKQLADAFGIDYTPPNQADIEPSPDPRLDESPPSDSVN